MKILDYNSWSGCKNMKAMALQIPFQYITLEKGVKVITNTIGVDFVRSPASVWNTSYTASAFYALIGL